MRYDFVRWASLRPAKSTSPVCEWDAHTHQAPSGFDIREVLDNCFTREQPGEYELSIYIDGEEENRHYTIVVD